ncbi:MAG: hypothetical protein ACTSUG_12645 [Candidatus Helarchaeota archaeon]
MLKNKKQNSENNEQPLEISSFSLSININFNVQEQIDYNEHLEGKKIKILYDEIDRDIFKKSDLANNFLRIKFPIKFSKSTIDILKKRSEIVKLSGQVYITYYKIGFISFCLVINIEYKNGVNIDNTISLLNELYNKRKIEFFVEENSYKFYQNEDLESLIRIISSNYKIRKIEGHLLKTNKYFFLDIYKMNNRSYSITEFERIYKKEMMGIIDLYDDWAVRREDAFDEILGKNLTYEDDEGLYISHKKNILLINLYAERPKWKKEVQKYLSNYLQSWPYYFRLLDTMMISIEILIEVKKFLVTFINEIKNKNVNEAINDLIKVRLEIFYSLDDFWKINDIAESLKFINYSFLKKNMEINKYFDEVYQYIDHLNSLMGTIGNIASKKRTIFISLVAGFFTTIIAIFELFGQKIATCITESPYFTTAFIIGSIIVSSILIFIAYMLVKISREKISTIIGF